MSGDEPRPVVSDLEDGEVTESDSDAVVEVPIPAPPADAQPLPLAEGNLAPEKPKPIEVADDSDRPRESSTTKAQRKRKNRKLRKEEEQMAKVSKTSAKIKQLEAAEMDEFEMLCVNGASPPRMSFDDAMGRAQDYAAYASDNSDDQRYHRSTAQERRELRRQRNRRRRRTNSTDDAYSEREGSTCGGVCIKNYRGVCMDPGCKRSHEFRQPRKLELCKFFLTGQCMKTNHCTYMHNDFPCKYFYLGIAHDKLKCQFAHGGPLEPAMQGALLKHIERAPKAILGDFPRVYQTQAGKMMRAQHEKLLNDLKHEGGEVSDSSGRSKKKKKKKSRHDDRRDGSIEPAIDPTDETGRWSPSGKLRVLPSKPVSRPRPEPVVRPEKPSVRLDSIPDVLNVGQLLGLRAIGIEYSAQIDQLTMAQMNEIGLNIGHIRQIQDAANRAHAMAGETAGKPNAAPGLVENGLPEPAYTMSGSLYQETSQDVDMRRFPVLATHPVMPDLSAFGIQSTALAPVNPLLVAPTPSISDQVASIPNPLLDSNKHGSDDDDDDAEDDDYGQLVIESDAEDDDNADA